MPGMLRKAPAAADSINDQESAVHCFALQLPEHRVSVKKVIGARKAFGASKSHSQNVAVGHQYTFAATQWLPKAPDPRKLRTSMLPASAVLNASACLE